MNQDERLCALNVCILLDWYLYLVSRFFLGCVAHEKAPSMRQMALLGMRQRLVDTERCGLFCALKLNALLYDIKAELRSKYEIVARDMCWTFMAVVC